MSSIDVLTEDMQREVLRRKGVELTHASATLAPNMDVSLQTMQRWLVDFLCNLDTPADTSREVYLCELI